MLLIALIISILIFIPLILIILKCRLLTTLKFQPFETSLLSHNLSIERFVDPFVVTWSILALWVKESRHWCYIRIQIFWVLVNAWLVEHLNVRVSFLIILGHKISIWRRKLPFVMTSGGLINSPISIFDILSSCATLTYIPIIQIAGWRPLNDFAFHFLTGTYSMESRTRFSSGPKSDRWMKPKISRFGLQILTIWLLWVCIRHFDWSKTTASVFLLVLLLVHLLMYLYLKLNKKVN